MRGPDDGTAVRDDSDPDASPDSGCTTPLVGSAPRPTALARVLSAAVLVLFAVVSVAVSVSVSVSVAVSVAVLVVLLVAVAVVLLLLLLVLLVPGAVSAARTGWRAPGADALRAMTLT